MIKISNISQYSELSSLGKYQTMVIESFVNNNYVKLSRINDPKHDNYISMKSERFLGLERRFNMFGDGIILYKYFDKL
jgi:hypothetical protein